MNHMSKQMIIILTGILIFTSGIMGLSCRKRPQLTKEQLFSQFDKNKDGRLSQEEFPGPDADFTELDKNSDSYLDENEVPDAPVSE